MIETFHFVRCDVSGCREWGVTVTRWRRSGTLPAAGELKGWTVVRGLQIDTADFCPEHSRERIVVEHRYEEPTVSDRAVTRAPYQPPIALRHLRARFGALLEALGVEGVVPVLATLTPRREQILRLRFGIHERRCYTRDEVGNRFGVGRERIRQLEAQALMQLARTPWPNGEDAAV